MKLQIYHGFHGFKHGLSDLICSKEDIYYLLMRWIIEKLSKVNCNQLAFLSMNFDNESWLPVTLNKKFS